MKKIAYALACALFLNSCGAVSEASIKIFQGTKVTPSDQIARASVELAVMRGNQWYTCSGVLLDSISVLTAAHCVDSSSAVSTVLATVKNQSRRVATWTIHSRYSRSLLGSIFPSQPPHDIAILRLQKPFSNDAAPAVIAASSTSKGNLITVAGFGESEDPNSDELRKMTTRVTSTDTQTAEIGASAFGARTGNGDSGGPAFIVDGARLSVVGVVSRTITLRGLDVYTDVAAHAAWVHCVLGNPGRENELCRNFK